MSSENTIFANNTHLPLTLTNLEALGASFANMKLSPPLPTPSPPPSLLAPPKIQADINLNIAESICTTCQNAAVQVTMEQAEETLYTTLADGAVKKLPLTREERNSVFCCKANKIICMGSGVDEGGKKEVIERFVKDIAHDEGRFLSKEDIEAAFLASKIIIEVQRSFDESTQARYFIPSIVFKKKYVEVHPKNIFFTNPVKVRNNHIFEFVKCRDAKHTKKPISRRITLLEKPQMPKGTKVYLECKGMWFTSELSGSWGHVWHASDEYWVPN